MEELRRVLKPLGVRLERNGPVRAWVGRRGHIIDVDAKPGSSDATNLKPVRQIIENFFLNKMKDKFYSLKTDPLQVSTELAVNALNHGNKLNGKPIRIELEYLEKQNEQSNHPVIRLTFKDMGAGISDEAIKKSTEKIERAPRMSISNRRFGKNN